MLPAKMLSILVILTILLTIFWPEGVHGQVFALGKCRRPRVQPNFDINRYLGKWYEVQRYFPIFFEMNLVCGTATYSLENGTLSVTNRGVNRLSKKENGAEGTATIKSNAKLQVTFQAQSRFPMFNSSREEGNYWVLETDYDSYTVVFSCFELFNQLFHADIIWILGRSPTLPRSRIDSIYSRLIGDGLRTWPFRKDMHKDVFECGKYNY